MKLLYEIMPVLLKQTEFVIVGKHKSNSTTDMKIVSSYASELKLFTEFCHFLNYEA